MTRRVAFVLPSFAGGGAERATLMLIRHLDRARFAPALVVLDGRGPLTEMRPADVPLTDLKRPRLRTALPRLIAALRALEPDLVFSTLVHVNLALSALRPFLPRRTALVLREANRPSASLATMPCPALWRLAYRLLARRADALLCNSRSTAEDMARRFGVPEHKVHLLPNPVDAAALRRLASPPLRQPGLGPRFVAAGRLTRQKGFDRLLEMFALVPVEAHLTICGEGPDEAALKARADELGLGARVLFTGFEPRPWPRYAGADAFLLSSRWEGMPNAALEALACGTPVIAAPEAGGVAELAEEASPGAVVLAPAGDAFVAGLRAVVPAPVREPRPSLLPSGHEPDRIAARFAVILESTLKPSAQRGGSRLRPGSRR